MRRSTRTSRRLRLVRTLLGALLCAGLAGFLLAPSSSGAVRTRPHPEPAAVTAAVDSVLVKYRDARPGHTPRISPSRLNALQRAAAQVGVHLSVGHTMGIGAYVVALDRAVAGAQLTVLIDRLQRADPAIVWAVPNHRVSTKGSAAVWVNDPLFNRQWNMGEGPGGIRAPTAWDEEWSLAAYEPDPGYVPSDDKGPRLVRFGQYGYGWSYSEITGDFSCTQPTFPGPDPAKDIGKRCEVATNWSLAATETHPFQLGHGVTRFVRYGWGDRWNYQAIYDHATCNNATFGDPWNGEPKICQVENRTDGGGVVAVQGGAFQVKDSATVEFGKADRWVYRQFIAGTVNRCDKSAFGGSDPWPTPAEERCEIVRSMGGGVTIGVLDKGIIAHPDLNTNIVPGHDFVSGDDDPTDPGGQNCGDTKADWHGLLVSGVASAVTHNGLGVAGVAPMSRTQMSRMADCNGTMNLADYLDALVWASGGHVEGVHDNSYPSRLIVLARIGLEERCDSYWQDAIDTVRANNALIVVAAGNDNRNLTNLNAAPGGCIGPLVVAGTDEKGARYAMSNYGGPVELAAPAVNVPVLANAGSIGPGASIYGLGTGTSVAAPEVAGVAAMMLSKNPALTWLNLRWRLVLSARPFPDPDACKACGNGILDANRALQSAQAITTESEPNDTPSGANYISAPADVSGTFDTSEDYFRFDLPPHQSMQLSLPTSPRPVCGISSSHDSDWRRCDIDGFSPTYHNYAATTDRVYIKLSGRQGTSYTFGVTWN